MKEAMRRRLAQAAENRGISLNAEMMRRLEDSFDQESNRSLDEIAHNMRTSAESVVAATIMLQSAAKLSSEAMLQATGQQYVNKLPLEATGQQYINRLPPEPTLQSTQFSAARRQKAVAALIAKIEELPIAERTKFNEEIAAARRAIAGPQKDEGTR
jgi:hypothetical protein